MAARRRWRKTYVHACPLWLSATVTVCLASRTLSDMGHQMRCRLLQHCPQQHIDISVAVLLGSNSKGVIAAIGHHEIMYIHNKQYKHTYVHLHIQPASMAAESCKPPHRFEHLFPCWFVIKPWAPLKSHAYAVHRLCT